MTTEELQSELAQLRQEFQEYKTTMQSFPFGGSKYAQSLNIFLNQLTGNLIQSNPEEEKGVKIYKVINSPETWGIEFWDDSGTATYLYMNSSGDFHIEATDAVFDGEVSIRGQSVTPKNNYVVASDFVKTGDTTLATVTGLEGTLVPGTYTFQLYLRMEDSGTTGGIKLGMGGTATTSSIWYQTTVISDDNAIKIAALAASLSTSANTTGRNFYFGRIYGTAVVTTGGTLNLQFAQQAANNASTVVKGSWMEISRIS